jgi:hypothetical protein
MGDLIITRRYMMFKKEYAVLFIIPLMMFAGYIEHTVTFSQPDLTHTTSHDYDVVRLRACSPTTEISHPELAVYHCLAVIPPSAKIEQIEIISADRIRLPEHYNILPVQYPKPFSLFDEPSSFVEPNDQVYSMTTEYPNVIAQNVHVGTKGGFRIANIELYPLQYIPATGELFLYTNIRFQIKYLEGKIESESVWEDEYEIQRTAVKRLVINPQDVEQWAPSVKTCRRVRTMGERGPIFTDPEYAIMVADGYESYFEPLKEWKSRKGVPTDIFLRDWILNNYSGSTNEAKIRNFVIDYHQNHSTQYFLCVGDWGTFPMEAVNTVDDPSTPSDFWYADYDDDLYTEVYLGRASISNATEAQTFVNKVMQYEMNTPASGFHEKIFLPGYLLWSGYGIPVNDTIAKYDPPEWLDAKRYDELDPLPTQEVSDSLNVGFGYTDIAAHGAWDRWGGTYYHTNSDADNLINAPPLTGVVTAICCNIGQLDYSGGDCYVEHMMNNSNGGSVAFWGNSRHGYGQIDSYGRSEWQCIWFYDELTNNNIYNIGMTVGEVNDRCAPYAPSDDYVFHCMNTCVLFADPEMSLWSYFPEDLIVAHDNTIPLGASSWDVTVTDNRAPVQDARVCLMCQADTMYRIGYTDASGLVTFSTNAQIPDDTVWVTVTKKDYRPYEGYATVVPVGLAENTRQKTHGFYFDQAYPNPASDHVCLSYSINKTGPVSLTVYNTAGQLVRTLLDEHKQAGEHRMVWHRTIGDKKLAAGIYFVKLTASGQDALQKVIFVKD